MMAVGLNIVVGYAGLLDLGYVAFYAAGAYIAAWFASQQFDQWTFHFGAVGIADNVPGIHLSIWIVLVIAGALTALAGILIGLPTLRLRGDYLAIVTLGFGEIIPQVVRNGDNVFGFDLTHRSVTSSRSSERNGFTGPRSRCCSSRSSARCGCATRDSVAPGSRSARTRPPPPRWVCR